MKITLVTFAYPDEKHPYAGVFFKTQAEILSELGHDVRVIVFGVHSLLDFKKSRINKEGSQIPVHRIFLPNPIPKTTFGIILTTLMVALYLRVVRVKEKPDIIHSMGIFTPSFLGALLAILWNVPHIVSEHRRSYFIRMSLGERLLVGIVYKLADKLFATSSHFSTIQNDQYFELSKKNFMVLPPFVPMMRLVGGVRGSNTLRARGLTKRKKSILVVGNLICLKNIHKVLNVFLGAPSLWSEWSLQIVGDGPLMGDLRRAYDRFVRPPGMSEPEVTFHGALNQSDLREIYSQVDLLCHVSDRETFGCAPLEAMQFGIPILLSKCGGPMDYFDDRCGLLIDDLSEAGISNGLFRIIRNIEIYNSEEIMSIANERYSIKDVAVKHLEVYSEAIIAKTPHGSLIV